MISPKEGVPKVELKRAVVPTGTSPERIGIPTRVPTGMTVQVVLFPFGAIAEHFVSFGDWHVLLLCIFVWIFIWVPDNGNERRIYHFRARFLYALWISLSEASLETPDGVIKDRKNPKFCNSPLCTHSTQLGEGETLRKLSYAEISTDDVFSTWKPPGNVMGPPYPIRWCLQRGGRNGIVGVDFDWFSEELFPFKLNSGIFHWRKKGSATELLKPKDHRPL